MSRVTCLEAQEGFLEEIVLEMLSDSGMSLPWHYHNAAYGVANCLSR